MNEALPTGENKNNRPLTRSGLARSVDMSPNPGVLDIFRGFAEQETGRLSYAIDPRFIFVTAEKGPRAGSQETTSNLVRVMGTEVDKLGLDMVIVHERVGVDENDTTPAIAIVSMDPAMSDEELIEVSDRLRVATNEILAGFPVGGPEFRVPAPIQD